MLVAASCFLRVRLVVFRRLNSCALAMIPPTRRRLVQGVDVNASFKIVGGEWVFLDP
jgi:hypothetical protein